MVNLKVQKPAKRYAEAFFGTIENNASSAINEFNVFLDTINANSELKHFLLHPVVSKKDKKAVVKDIFRSFDINTLNFLCVLIDENRINCANDIKNFLVEKLNQKNNIVEADVTLALEADDNIKSLIRSHMQAKLGSNLLINFKKDEKIIGGMVVKIGDTLVDLSIKKKLENFKQV